MERHAWRRARALALFLLLLTGVWGVGQLTLWQPDDTFCGDEVAMAPGGLSSPVTGERAGTARTGREGRGDGGGPVENAPRPAPEGLLKRYGTPALLSRFSTDFSHAGASQAGNIRLAALRLRGTLLQPGELFSYNARVGPFTAEAGFGPGEGRAGGRIVTTEGGGVCQVSSTLYSAALLAGLPVVERHPHSVRVPYMPPGRDAAVTIPGGKDLRLLNDSGDPLFFWADTGGQRLTIWIFGANQPLERIELRHEVLAREAFSEITLEEELLQRGERRLLAPGREGLTVRYWLVRSGPGGTRREELGVDRYQPAPRVLAVGPGQP